MRKYVTVSEMRAIEQEADQLGLTYAQMMENAGVSLGQIVAQEFGSQTNRTVVGLVGSGNNGGDTLVALAYLAKLGWKVVAYLVKERPADDPLVGRVLDRGGMVICVEKDDAEYRQLQAAIGQSDVLLDGVLGTGFQLPLKESLAKVLKAAKRCLEAKSSPTYVVAVDCPSGVDCDRGQASEETLPAHLTVTMAAVKAGLLKFPAYSFCGRIEIADIGLDHRFPKWESISRFVIDDRWVQERLPRRPDDSHKGTFGTVLIIAGSENFTGAAYLAAKAAYLSGAGLVTLGVVRSVYQSLAGHLPEATWLVLPEQGGFLSEASLPFLAERLKTAEASVVGPGFGLHSGPSGLIKGLLELGQENLTRLVIDADGLKLLVQDQYWYQKLPRETVLTPHPGEMGVLTGLKVAEIQAERIRVAEQFAQQWGQVVVLKGAFSVIAEPGGRTAVSPIATSALARAGTGDVLAGLIGGLRAQGMNAFEAAASGVWIHGQAGLLAAQKLGTSRCVLASDVLEAIPEIFSRLSR